MEGGTQKRRFFKSKLFWIITIIILLIGGSVGGYAYYNHQLEVKKAKEVAAKKAKLLEEERTYDENFRKALNDLYTSYSNSKIITDQYIKAWSDVIFTGGYLSDDGLPVIDVSFAFIDVQTNIEVNGDLETLNNSDIYLQNDIGNLGEPPKKFKEVTDRFNNLYGKYQTLYNLATAPDENSALLTYKEQCDTLSSQIESEYNQIKASIPKVE